MGRFYGQSLVEYSVIVIFIAVAAIPALTFLGGNVSINLMAFAEGIKKQPPKSAPAASSTDTPTTDPTKTTAQTKPSTVQQPVASTKPILSTASISDLKTLVQVSGANGTTGYLSNRILQIGQDLLNAGEISPEQADLFMQLANQGHKISEIEKLVEDADKNGLSTIQYEGKSYARYDLAQQIGWPNEPVTSSVVANVSEMIQRSPDKRSPEMNTFIQLYQTLEQSGAMQNPQVKSSVDTLSAQIATLSETVEAYSAQAKYNMASVSLSNQAISSISHFSSAKICQAGSTNTDSGVQCSN